MTVLTTNGNLDLNAVDVMMQQDNDIILVGNIRADI